MQRTIRCLLLTDPAQADALHRTSAAFARGCNIALASARLHKTSNKIRIQKVAYRDIRSCAGLSSNLTIRAIARVSGNIKTAAKEKKTVREYAPASIDFDARIFNYRESDQSVSVKTLDRRIRLSLKIGDYQRSALTGKTPTCAKIVRNKNRWSIHITIDEEAPPKRLGPPMGIDLGITNIAATSNGRLISGKEIQDRKARFARIRASLQSKGTRGAKRVLRRLSGRERRFIAWTNHQVANSIIQEALDGNFGLIRMEDLRGIRKRTKTWNKHRNRMLSGWSFGELQDFICYKAERVGLATEKVHPAWTSQTCHRCGSRGLRSGEAFRCLNDIFCGWAGHADINAACTVAAGGVGAGAPAVCNATRIDEHDVPLRVQSKAAGL